MVTEEEILKAIERNETFATATSFVKKISFEQDYVDIEFNLYLWSPMVNGTTLEVIDPKAKQRRRAVSLRFPLSKLYDVGAEMETVRVDVGRAMDSAKGTTELTEKYNERGDRLLKVTEQLDAAQQRIKDYEDDHKAVMEEKCGDDRVHCTCVPGLRAAVKEARDEVFDLYHQDCCIEISQDGSYVRYDNQCMCVYEYAEDKLIEWGLLKPEQCLRRKKGD